MDDRLHEPYRLKLIPGAAEALVEAREKGLAAALSGAGPSIIDLPTSKWGERGSCDTKIVLPKEHKNQRLFDYQRLIGEPG